MTPKCGLRTDAFRALVEQYNERSEEDTFVSDVLNDFSEEIVDLIQQLKAERDSFCDLGIVPVNRDEVYKEIYPKPKITRNIATGRFRPA